MSAAGLYLALAILSWRCGARIAYVCQDRHEDRLSYAVSVGVHLWAAAVWGAL